MNLMMNPFGGMYPHDKEKKWVLATWWQSKCTESLLVNQPMSYGTDLPGTLYMFTSSPDSVSTLMAITHILFQSDTVGAIANENSALQ